VAAATLISACGFHGPGATRTSHLAYNEAVQTSEQRELLLNIVRLRYLDSPGFLEISSISTQLRIDGRVGVFGAFGDGEGGSITTIAPDASVGYEEAPVVTFSPRHDAVFTRELVTPAEMETIFLLSSYGWGLERVLALVSESINDLSNDTPRETAPDAQHIASQRFLAFCSALGTLQDRGLITMQADVDWVSASGWLPAASVGVRDFLTVVEEGMRLTGNEVGQFKLERPMRRYELHISPEASATPAATELMTLAGLDAGRLAYSLVGNADSDGNTSGSIHLRTRSVLGSMAWLSTAVYVPDPHLASGLAPHRDALVAGVSHWFTVSYAASEPADAWLAVPYRDYWFYIDAKDLNTRRTFGLLTSLIRLEIGTADADTRPVLTLPVSR
jgi:hypothetical protein